VFEETPHCEVALAAGFFFSGRRNEFAAIRIALVRKAGILPRNVSSLQPRLRPESGGFSFLRSLFRIRTSRSTSQPSGVSATRWKGASLTACRTWRHQSRGRQSCAYRRPPKFVLWLGAALGLNYPFGGIDLRR